MAFWSDATGQDPKRQYRWIMIINDIPAYTLKKANKPSFTVTESVHKYLNHLYYYQREHWVLYDKNNITTKRLSGNNYYKEGDDDSIFQFLNILHPKILW